MREHDPEWPLYARVLAVSWKVPTFLALGLLIGAAEYVGGYWLAALGVLILIGWVGCLRQIMRERHESRPLP